MTWSNSATISAVPQNTKGDAHMNAKKGYLAPEAEVILFTDADVITASDEAGHTTTSPSSEEEDTRLPMI